MAGGHHLALVWQVDALLSEVRIDYVRADSVDTLLQRLQKLLTSLPQRTIDKAPNEVAMYLEAHGMPQVLLHQFAILLCSCSFAPQSASLT